MAFITKRGTKYVVNYKDENGRLTRKTVSPDKTVADQMMAQIVRDVERRKCGLSNTFTDAAKQPIAELVEEYRLSLEAKEDTPDHVKRTIQKITDILEGKGMRNPKPIRRIAELTPTAVNAWLTNKRKTVGYATSNRYLTAIKGFSKWLWETDKTPNHRLVSLKPLNEELDEKHPRRSLKDKDFQRFLSLVKESREVFQGLNGITRWRLYLVASLTGLRAGELLGLTVKQFDFEYSSWLIKAKNTKAKKTVELGLSAILQNELQTWITAENLKPNDRLFNVSKHLRTADLIKEDLDVAGIPYEIDGYYFDFHALRGQFCTMLERAGVSLKKAQDLMRHSTPVLTSKYYSRPDIADLGAAVNQIQLLPTNSKAG